MQDLNIKKTTCSDFEKVYPLLLDFNSPFDYDDWMNIFNYCWDGVEDYVGYHLEQDTHVVGFMGLIFSYKLIEGKKIKFCNISSLIVKPEYRASSILFIRKLNELKDVILTGLGPIEASYQLLSRVGFKTLETHSIIIPVINGLLTRQKINYYEMPKLLELIDVEPRRIVQDHMNKNCKILLLNVSDKFCLLVYKLIMQKHKGILVKKIRIIHIGDPVFFRKHIPSVLRIFLKLFGFATALYLDQRFISPGSSCFFITKPIEPPKIYRGDISVLHIDELYSETSLL